MFTSKLFAICSSIISFICLFFTRQIDSDGDLFTQINLSILCGFALSSFILLARKKGNAKRFSRANLHLLITVQLIVFILLQFSLVNIDRSRSFYVLSWANQNKVFQSRTGVTLVNVQSPEKLNSLAIQVRIDEQIQKNLLKLQGDKIEPSMGGKMMVLIADSLANLFKLENWKLNKN